MSPQSDSLNILVLFYTHFGSSIETNKQRRKKMNTKKAKKKKTQTRKENKTEKKR